MNPETPLPHKSADIQWSNALLPLQFVEAVVCPQNEWALPQAEAVVYLRWCPQNNIEILGSNVWAATTPTALEIEVSGERKTERFSLRLR